MVETNQDKGSTLIVVLLAMGFFSFVSVYLAHYAQFMKDVTTVPETMINSGQALKFARNKTLAHLRNTLSDTKTIDSPKTIQWDPPGSVRIQTTIRSLNGKLNLNRLLVDSEEKTRKLLDDILESQGYPPRTLQELKFWVGVDDRDESISRYTGYGYSPPGREFYHRDEITLVSGFIQRGLTRKFKQIFTVYGTGKFNPLHLTPNQWLYLQSALDLNVPSIPSNARGNQKQFREFLKQEQVWRRMKKTLPFLTHRDDSFQIDYQIKMANAQRRYRSIYVFNHLENSLELKMRRPIFRSKDQFERSAASEWINTL